jgi:hypothetical protein
LLITLVIGTFLRVALVGGEPKLVVDSYPTACDVDHALSRVTSLNPDERVRDLAAIVAKLARPSDAADDAVAEYFFARVTETAGIIGEESLLAALDVSRFRGGFANMVCVTYRHFARTPIFTRRYRMPSHHSAIERCFQEKELDQLLAHSSDEVDNSRHAEAGRTESPGATGCEIDDLKARWGTLDEHARATYVRTLLHRAIDGEKRGELAAARLLARAFGELLSRYRDTLLVRMVDEVAGSNPTASICIFWDSVGRDEVFVKYYGQRRRRVFERCLKQGWRQEDVDGLLE